MRKRNVLIIIITITVLVILFLSIDTILKIKSTQTTKGYNVISSFEECIAAGNPAMESYPRKCIDSKSDKTFTEVIDDVWMLDGIQLMQHETEGYFDCFGCSESLEGPAICIDPIPAMKLVTETSERYCNDKFEIIKNGVGNAICGNNICEGGEADIEGGCGPNADPGCLGPPSYSGTCPEDC